MNHLWLVLLLSSHVVHAILNIPVGKYETPPLANPALAESIIAVIEGFGFV